VPRRLDLDASRLVEVNEWLAPFTCDWGERMKALGAVLDEEER
jgi:hypothetical protein